MQTAFRGFVVATALLSAAALLRAEGPAPPGRSRSTAGHSPIIIDRSLETLAGATPR